MRADLCGFSRTRLGPRHVTSLDIHAAPPPLTPLRQRVMASETAIGDAVEELTRLQAAGVILTSRSLQVEVQEED